MTRECAICGHHSLDVRPGLVAWIDVDSYYANVDRCTDQAACRARVEARGDTWPVREKVEKGADR